MPNTHAFRGAKQMTNPYPLSDKDRQDWERLVAEFKAKCDEQATEDFDKYVNHRFYG